MPAAYAASLEAEPQRSGLLAGLENSKSVCALARAGNATAASTVSARQIRRLQKSTPLPSDDN
jgi:hypothetical protein